MASTYGYTLAFDANGGQGAPQSVMVTGGTAGYIQTTLPTTAPIRDGYVFAGWATNSDGTGVIRTPSGTYTGYAAAPYPQYTLYAVWKRGAQAWIYADGRWHRTIPHLYSGGWHVSLPSVY